VSNEWDFDTWSDKDLAKLQRKGYPLFSSGEANALPSSNGRVYEQACEAADAEVSLEKLGECQVCPKTPSHT
jgi:hypothetical protein